MSIIQQQDPRTTLTLDDEVDADIVLHGYNSSSPEHGRARQWLEAALATSAKDFTRFPGWRVFNPLDAG